MTRIHWLRGESSARSMLRLLRREPAEREVVLAAGGNSRTAIVALNRHVQAGHIQVVMRLTRTGRKFLKENGG